MQTKRKASLVDGRCGAIMARHFRIHIQFSFLITYYDYYDKLMLGYTAVPVGLVHQVLSARRGGEASSKSLILLVPVHSLVASLARPLSG
jgi:hypothetical protein